MSIYARHNGMDHSAMGSSDTPSMGGMEGHGMPGMKMYMHGTIGGDVLWFASWQPSSAGATVGVCIGLFLFAVLDRYLHAVWRACAAHWNRGNVGLAMPVTKGELPYSASSSSPSSSSSAVASMALDSLSQQDLRRRDAPITATTTPAPVTGSCCAEKASIAESQRACDCGCGGECGQSSSCRGTGNCVPEYATPLAAPAEKPTGPPADPAVAYLPRAVRGTLDPARRGRWSRPFRVAADLPRGLFYMLITIFHFALMLVVMTFQLWWIISVVVGLGVGEGLFGRFGAGL